MTITQAQLARELGLSQVAVSHALRGKPGVADETRQRVLDAARRGGYRVSRVARGMVSGKTQLIDLWMGTKNGVSRTPPNLMQGLQHAAESSGMQIAVSYLNDDRLTDPDDFPAVFREHAADGILINYSHLVPDRLFQLLERFGIPAIWINNKLEHDAVHPDDIRVGELAAQRFLELGHRRLAMFSIIGGGHYSQQDRWAGFSRVARDAGVEPIKIEQPGGPGLPYRSKPRSDDRVDQLVARLRTEGVPSAIFAYAVGEGVAIMTALARLGIDCPKDVSVIVVADEPMPVLLPLPISTVVLPQQELGQIAVEELMARIARPESPRPAVAVAPTYVESRTTAPPPK
ncbi:MAG: LacI family DNA-binding transcriptional regulator [Planctomycetota bacterium]